MRRDDLCLYLGPADRAQLEMLCANRNTPRKVVWRAEIVLATADARGIPLALVDTRMNADAFARRARWTSLYADLLGRFRLITTQDPTTARHLQALGAAEVSVIGSLKAAALSPARSRPKPSTRWSASG